MHDDEADTTALRAAPVATVPLPAAALLGSDGPGSHRSAADVAPATVTSGVAGPGLAAGGLGTADRALHSDPHDFAGLYIRHRSSFTLHARRYLHDARDADEVVQEAFLRLFLALPELETELQALAYCRRTITNLCIDRYRAQARRPRLVDLDSVSADELADEDPGDPVVRAEDAALVRDALSMLSPLHRAALVKREIEEKPLPVIAEELEIAEDSVKHVLFRARRALRRLLAATSLAPGNDAEGPGAVGLAKAGSSGLAALLMLVVLGLGSGPNLTAIPVVGSDLPDLPGVTDLAKVVGNAVTDVSRAVTDSVTSSDGRGGSQQGPSGDGGGVPDPVPAPGDGASSSLPATEVEGRPAPIEPRADQGATAEVGRTAELDVAARPAAPTPAAPSASPLPSTSPDAEELPALAPEPARTERPAVDVLDGSASPTTPATEDAAPSPIVAPEPVVVPRPPTEQVDAGPAKPAESGGVDRRPEKATKPKEQVGPAEKPAKAAKTAPGAAAKVTGADSAPLVVEPQVETSSAGPV